MKQIVSILLILLLASFLNSVNAQVTQGIVKAFDIFPEERISNRGVMYYNVDKGVVIIVKSFNPTRIELWRQFEQDQKPIRFYDEDDFSIDINAVIPWDSDKLLMWLEDKNQWLVTDGTQSGTRRFDEIDELVENAGVFARSALQFVQSDGDDIVIGYNYNFYRYSNNILTKIDANFEPPKRLEIKAVLGDFLFFTEFLGQQGESLNRLNIKTLEKEQLYTNLILDNTFSFHDPIVQNFIFLEDSTLAQSNLHRMSGQRLDIEGFFMVENNGQFELFNINGEGEVSEALFSSENPIAVKKTLRYEDIYYIQLLGNGTSAMARLDLAQREITVFDIDILSSASCTSYDGYEPLVIVETGIIFAARSACFSNDIFHFYYYNESNEEFQQLTNGDDILGLRYELLAVTENHLLMRINDSNNNVLESEFYRLNTQSFTLDSVPQADNQALMPEFALGNNFIMSGIEFDSNNVEPLVVTDNLVETPFDPIRYLYRLSAERNTFDAYHFFNNATDANKTGARVFETSQGIHAQNRAGRFSELRPLIFNLVEDNTAVVASSAMIGEGRFDIVFTSEDYDSIIIEDFQSTITDKPLHYFLNPTSGIVSDAFTIAPFEDGSFLTAFIDIDSSKNILMQFRNESSGGLNLDYKYGVLDVSTLSVHYIQSQSETGFNDGAICADTLTLVGEDSVVVDPSGSNSAFSLKGRVTRWLFSEQGFIVLATYDDTNTERIYTFNCSTNALAELFETNFSPEDLYFPARFDLGYANTFLVNIDRVHYKIDALNQTMGEVTPLNSSILNALIYEMIDTSEGVYVFAYLNDETTNEISTKAYKEQDGNYALVDEMIGRFNNFYSSPRSPLGRIFLQDSDRSANEIFQKNGGELVYFSPKDNKFGFIDVVEGIAVSSYINNPFISDQGHLYVSVIGDSGASFYAINLNCTNLVDIGTCPSLLTNSAPTLFLSSTKKVVSSQQISIAIRGVDIDRDMLIHDTSNLPTWLIKTDKELLGRVPSNFEGEIGPINIEVSDGFGGISSGEITIDVSNKVAQSFSFSELSEAPTPAPPPPPAPTPAPSSGESSGGGSMGILSFGFLALILFCRYRFKAADHRFC